MKKIKVIFIIALGIMISSFQAFRNVDPVKQIDVNGSNIPLAVDSKQLNVNNISSWYRTNGSFNRDPTTGNSGFEWPKGSAKYARYASGLWIGSRVGSSILVCLAEYDYEYLPGYIDNGGFPQGNTDPNYKIYLIDRGDTTSPDYQNWPVNQGAYVNAQGRPFFLGTQTMFYSYTDGYPESHVNNAGSTEPLKAVILQTNWSYTNTGLRDVQFIEFRIINRSTQVWNDAYFAFWTDDDLGDATDDAIACDTIRDLGYTYNFAANDPIYGAGPPAVGTKLLRSPIMFTGNSNDTVKYYHPPGSQNLKVKVGYKFTRMNVFNTYNNGGSPPPGDPSDFTQTYNALQGLWTTGEAWFNPTTGQTTKKVYSGDPVNLTGWRMSSGSDRRFLQSFGPLTVNPNDTQSIIVAQIIARGSTNLNSITQLKALSDHVQTVYNNNFQEVLAVNTISGDVPVNFNLGQNYPNPFNPVTSINFELPESGSTKLTVYDALGREVTRLINNEFISAGKYEVDFNGTELTSGLYFYRLESNGFVQTRKMMLVK